MNSPIADPRNEIIIDNFRPSESASCVEKIPPIICAKANIIDEVNGSIVDAPDFSKIKTP